jgi:xylan 1,4-beta-xylosidase
MRTAAILLLTLAAGAAGAERVAITVRADSATGPWKPFYAYFGYDEPNYTYMKDGRKLLGQLAALTPAPVFVRAHYLLCSGDGAPGLKWGSTNVYTEDAAGRPVYDWTLMDRIFDAWLDAGVKPLVEIGFMPEALSSRPAPYRHRWPEGDISTGVAYPPKDYAKWAELVYQWVRHSVERYGQEEVGSWWWEVWNEPDIGYWRGTPEEYWKLYDYAADAVKRALPAARIGGPHSTGPGSPKAADFLRRFLEHCARGVNYATGRTGAPLDYVGFHAKGRPEILDGRVRMGIARQLESIRAGFEIVASFPEFRELPVIIGESDPEGCAACSAAMRPDNAYRNGPLYPAYNAAVLGGTAQLAARYGVRLEGSVTWAFEFEDQPWFAGFRSLATNGVAKPVLNGFRMLGLMEGESVEVSSSHAIPAERMIAGGVRGEAEVSALATRSARKVVVLLWNYHDDDRPAPAAAVDLVIHGFPAAGGPVLVRHYRIDENHSNAYSAWRAMGSPQRPTPEQYLRLDAASRLELCESPAWRRPADGSLRLELSLPRHALSLVEVER